MKYMLDTNICIYLIRQKPRQVLSRFQECQAGEICISSITAAELFYGVQKSQRPEQNREALEQFLIPLIIADFDARAAAAYGKIRPALESQGTPIGALDLLIAAHALSLQVTLVTNNTAEFERVHDLNLDNWVSE